MAEVKERDRRSKQGMNKVQTCQQLWEGVKQKEMGEMTERQCQCELDEWMCALGTGRSLSEPGIIQSV